MNPFSRLGQALRALRIKKGLSQAEVAATLCIRPSQISRWETGGALKMKVESLGDLLRVYGADLGDLAGELDLFGERSPTLAIDSLINSTLARLRGISNPPIPQPETGQRLRQLRERSGWTPEEIAERTKVPLKMLVAFEEGGEAALSVPELDLLAQACCGTLEDVLPDRRGKTSGPIAPRGGASWDPLG